MIRNVIPGPSICKRVTVNLDLSYLIKLASSFQNLPKFLFAIEQRRKNPSNVNNHTTLIELQCKHQPHAIKTYSFNTMFTSKRHFPFPA